MMGTIKDGVPDAPELRLDPRSQLVSSLRESRDISMVSRLPSRSMRVRFLGGEVSLVTSARVEVRWDLE